MDNYLLPSTAVVTALAVSILLFRKTSGDGYDKKLAPGPPPTFLVGHTFQMPKTSPWAYFEDMGKLYGMILLRMTHVNRQTFVVFRFDDSFIARGQ